MLYSRTHGGIPVWRTVTIHIFFGASITRFNISFSFFQVLLRPHLHFYWPFVLRLNYCTLRHIWILSIFGFVLFSLASLSFVVDITISSDAPRLFRNYITPYRFQVIKNVSILACKIKSFGSAGNSKKFPI